MALCSKCSQHLSVQRSKDRGICLDCWDKIPVGGFIGGVLPAAAPGTVFDPSEETRKDGKVRVELVFEGMPRALMELGRIMTWAIEEKGYKEGDWVNVPNAKQEYRGAMLRHDLKEIAGESHDLESKRRHAAHTAWNAMARLELLLQGDEQ